MNRPTTVVITLEQLDTLLNYSNCESRVEKISPNVNAFNVVLKGFSGNMVCINTPFDTLLIADYTDVRKLEKAGLGTFIH